MLGKDSSNMTTSLPQLWSSFPYLGYSVEAKYFTVHCEILDRCAVHCSYDILWDAPLCRNVACTVV